MQEHGPAIVISRSEELLSAALMRGSLDGTRLGQIDPEWQAELKRATRGTLKGVQQMEDSFFMEMVSGASHGRLTPQSVKRLMNALSTTGRILAGPKEKAKDAQQLERLHQDIELFRHVGMALVIFTLPLETGELATADEQLEESSMCICACSERDGRLWKVWEAPIYASDFALNRDAVFINMQLKALALSLLSDDQTIGMPSEARAALEAAARVMIIRSMWDLTSWVIADERGVHLTEDLLKHITTWNH